jgi:formiminotetrahydrofolate cyclodeaminase
VVALCAEILDGANPNLLSDVGVAAVSAAAAVDATAFNVEINLAHLEDVAFVAAAARDLDAHRSAVGEATTVAAAVRDRIGR